MDVGRVAVVTGASSGIGAATVHTLAGAGYGVVAAARRTDRLTALADEATAAARAAGTGGDVLPMAGDVTAEGLVEELFAAARRRWGRQPDTFVLSAGHGLPGTLLGSDQARWRDLVEVNYLAVAQQLRDCAASFRRDVERDPSVPVRDIVVIGSTIGRTVSPFNPVYGSTKFAVHALTEGLRQEVCEHTIRTTLIEPGFVRSEFQETAGYDMTWFDSLEQASGPFLLPSDIARTIQFVLGQPPYVHLDTIRVRPTRQKI
jgi:NADP-dependent 3-hydroxy acid dehydrogenase YdfG